MTVTDEKDKEILQLHYEIEELKESWKRQIPANIDKGEQVFSLYKGEALQRLTGDMSDEEALVLGHFDGSTNVTLNTIKTSEDGLNKISSLPAELVPMVKRIKKRDLKPTDKLYKKGMIYVQDEQEAKIQAEFYGYSIINQEGIWYFDYPGMVIKDRIMTDFVYNVARASGSLGGETKNAGLTAVSNIHPVPVFPQPQAYSSTWQSPIEPDEDGE